MYLSLLVANIPTPAYNYSNRPHVEKYMYLHILHGYIKGYNGSVIAIMCEVGSYRTVAR